MRDQKQILRIQRSILEEAAWEETEDDDDSCFNMSTLECIFYFNPDSLTLFLLLCTFYVVAKMPNQCKYVVMGEDSRDFGAFFLQGGSNTSLKSANGMVVHLAKSCFIVFKRAKSSRIAPVKIFPQIGEAASQTVQDVLKFRGRRNVATNVSAVGRKSWPNARRF